MLALRIDASFLRYKPMFGPRADHTGFVVNKLVLLGAFLRGVWITDVSYHFTSFMFICIIRGLNNRLE